MTKAKANSEKIIKSSKKQKDESKPKIEIKVPAEVEKPEASLLTREELEQLNLSEDSCDPSGKYKIVIRATELDFMYVALSVDQLRGKFCLAPPDYYWKFFSEKCYYNFDWYELKPIPK
jgi:hypothetical protein